MRAGAAGPRPRLTPSVARPVEEEVGEEQARRQWDIPRAHHDTFYRLQILPIVGKRQITCSIVRAT
jgi:hypothetical protein